MKVVIVHVSRMVSLPILVVTIWQASHYRLDMTRTAITTRLICSRVPISTYIQEEQVSHHTKGMMKHT